MILRTHIAWVGSELGIITAEPYSTSKYVYEQLTDRVVAARINGTSGLEGAYFAVTGKFVRDDMQGRFPNSTIIMMGCFGYDLGTARSFANRGAGQYVAWEGHVTPEHTDMTTILLLESLFQGKTLGEAVDTAMVQAGPDPLWQSRLNYYDFNAMGQLYSPVVTPSIADYIALGAILALMILGPTVVILVPKWLSRLEETKSKALLTS